MYKYKQMREQPLTYIWGVFKKLISLTEHFCNKPRTMFLTFVVNLSTGYTQVNKKVYKT